VTYNVITRIKAVLINGLIDFFVAVICSPRHIQILPHSQKTLAVMMRQNLPWEQNPVQTGHFIHLPSTMMKIQNNQAWGVVGGQPEQEPHHKECHTQQRDCQIHLGHFVRPEVDQIGNCLMKPSHKRRVPSQVSRCTTQPYRTKCHQGRGFYRAAGTGKRDPEKSRFS
jgi:hypothetical protein